MSSYRMFEQNLGTVYMEPVLQISPSLVSPNFMLNPTVISHSTTNKYSGYTASCCDIINK
jgi:hypothetical protein